MSRIVCIPFVLKYTKIEYLYDLEMSRTSGEFKTTASSSEEAVNLFKANVINSAESQAAGATEHEFEGKAVSYTVDGVSQDDIELSKIEATQNVSRLVYWLEALFGISLSEFVDIFRAGFAVVLAMAALKICSLTAFVGNSSMVSGIYMGTVAFCSVVMLFTRKIPLMAKLSLLTMELCTMMLI